LAEVENYADVPYLEEILLYLPIEPTDKEDVFAYIKNLTNLIVVNYKYEQYQFAYFGLHLLYMTYIYCTVWKVSKIIPEECSYASIFAKAYGNVDFDFCDVESIFEYSNIPEKEIGKIFRTIELHPGQIGNITGLVDDRNDMAHASGKFEILTDENFNIKANTIYNSIKNIHKCMDKQIRTWFKDILLKYCKSDFNDYSDINDIISEQMVQNFNLSVNELLICDEMSVRDMISDNRNLEEPLKKFKEDLKKY
jgi:hypothetical protein